jgi:signal recognition particle subunit SRP54
MRHVTGLPIKFLGAGEKIDALDVFDARRVAGRILGMGDIVGLVEKAAAEMDQAKAERMAKRLAKGKFDLDDLANQLDQMQKMGGMQGLMGMMPGVAKMKDQLAQSGVNDKTLSRQRSIIGSMTKAERKNPDLLAASRKRRVAAGAGVDVAEINRLLKQHRQMSDAFKSMARDGGKGFARMAQMLGGMPGMGGGGGLGGMFGGGGGMPKMPPGMPDLGNMSQADLEKLKAQLGGGKLPGGLGGLSGFPFKK